MTTNGSQVRHRRQSVRLRAVSGRASWRDGAGGGGLVVDAVLELFGETFQLPAELGDVAPRGAEIGGEEQHRGQAEQEQPSDAAADQVRQLLGRIERVAHAEVADEDRDRARGRGDPTEDDPRISEPVGQLGRHLDERHGLTVVRLTVVVRGCHHHLQR